MPCLQPVADYRAGKRRVVKGNRLEKIDLHQLDIRVADMHYLLDVCLDSSAAYMKHYSINPDAVGIMGHSLGGATALAALAADHRILAAYILDAWYIPLSDSLIASGIQKPFLHLGQYEWQDPNNYLRINRLYAHSPAPQFKVLLAQSMHTDFTDMPLFTPFSYLIGYTGYPNPDFLLQLTSQTGMHFFDTYLKHTPSQALQNYLNQLPHVSVSSFVPGDH